MSRQTSFLILAFNSEATIAEAIQAALAQQGASLDILISDDCSTDKTFAIIEGLTASYSGPHRLRVHRQPRNLGLVGNVMSAAALCEGDLIIGAAGDDRSHPQRAERLTHAWVEAGSPTAALAYSDVRPIDAAGAPVQDWPERVARPPWSLKRLVEGRGGPIGAASAFTPRLLLSPGPLDHSVRHEDRVLPFRALLLGGKILFVDEPLVDYRVTGGMSRIEAAGGYDELTVHLHRRLTNVLPDARQRLNDAIAAEAPTKLVHLCQRVISEQEAMLAMSDGKRLIRKAVRGVSGGARPGKIAAYLARLALAKARQWG